MTSRPLTSDQVPIDDLHGLSCASHQEQHRADKEKIVYGPVLSFVTQLHAWEVYRDGDRESDHEEPAANRVENASPPAVTPCICSEVDVGSSHQEACLMQEAFKAP